MSHRPTGNITITWNAYGKVDEILNGDTAAPIKKTKFGYDSAQNRVLKATYDQNDILIGSTYYVRDAQGNVMSTYKEDAAGNYTWTEAHIYGSSRLGITETEVLMDAAIAKPNFIDKDKNLNTGWKRYELSNHLGNVISVINDRKDIVESGNTDDPIASYKPVVISANDYYPFGLQMDGRNFTLGGAKGHRYGFNGKEKDQDGEWGSNTHYDYGFRIYNPAIAKFLSVDPLTSSYPWYTPYQFAGNSPITFIDLDGLEMASPMALAIKDKPIFTGIAIGAEEFVNETWQFLSVDAWKLSTWKMTGQLIGEAHLKASWGPLAPDTPLLDQVVDHTVETVKNDIINGDAHSRSKAGTKLTLGLATAVAGDKGASKALSFVKGSSQAGRVVGVIARKLDGFADSQGFTGVFDKATNKIAYKPSNIDGNPITLRDGSVIEDVVEQFGGHGPVADAMGGMRDTKLGFAIIKKSDDVLEIRWNSRTLNGVDNPSVPEEFKASILEKVKAEFPDYLIE